MTITQRIKNLESTIAKAVEELEEIKNTPVDPPKVEFEVGKWYYFVSGDISWLFNYKGINHTLVSSNCAISSYSGWNDASTALTNYEKLLKNKTLRPATESEIKEALTKQIEKLGFTKGVEYKSMISAFTYNYKGNLKYIADDDKLVDNGECSIYHQGKFATIVKEEAIKIGGYDVIIWNEFVTIDGNTFTKEFWEAAKLISEHSKAKIMIGCSKQFDVSLDTINAILEKLK